MIGAEHNQDSATHRVMSGQVHDPLWRFVLRRGGVIASFNKAGSGSALYCVHPIFGDVTSFRPLAEALGPEQLFYGIQVPGIHMKPEFASSIEAVAQRYVKEIIAFQPHGAIVLGGWSAGAIIALEMAQQLRAIGREVPLLVAFDGAPCNTGAGMGKWNPLYALGLICNIPGWVKHQKQGSLSFQVIFKRAIKKVLLRMKMATSTLRNEQTLDGREVQGLLGMPGWRGDKADFVVALYNALRLYVPAPYDGRVVVYEAKTQPLDHLRQVGAVWRKVARQAEVVRLDVNHISLFMKPCIDVIARDLQARLLGLRVSG